MAKYYQIKVGNKTDAPMPIQLDMVYKLVLGQCEEQTARYLYSEWDETSNSILVRNVYHPIYHNKVLQLTAITDTDDAKTPLQYELDYPNRKNLGMQITIPANAEKEVAFILAVHEQGEPPVARFTLSEINRQ